MTPKRIKLLFATKNPGKLAEFKKAFDKLRRSYEIISLNDLPYDIPDCEENGTTFEENATLKAQNTKKHLQGSDKNLIVIADDSGIKIDYLNGKPGVFSRRWNGSEMSDDEIIDYCLDRLKGVSNRSAAYVSCFVVSTPDGEDKVITDENLGVILDKPNRDSALRGMPFRSLFFVPKLNMMFHEVRDLSVEKREGYILGHEQAIGQIADYLDDKQR